MVEDNTIVMEEMEAEVTLRVVLVSAMLLTSKSSNQMPTACVLDVARTQATVISQETLKDVSPLFQVTTTDVLNPSAPFVVELQSLLFTVFTSSRAALY